MKKWWVGLLLMAVALVMIPATALAKIEKGESYDATCPVDGTVEGHVISEINISENSHSFTWLCMGCQNSYYINESHYGGSPTCSTAAVCDGCGASYKDPNNHDWAPWISLDHDRHYRVCRGCGSKEYKKHSGGTATCNAQAECEYCHGAYGDYDAGNHENTRTAYANATGEQHRVTVVCEDCKQTVSDAYEAHDWGKWTADGMTHSRTCQKPGCGAVDTGRHTSEPGATCVTAQACAICNAQYLDGTNHEGGRVTTYAIDPDDTHQHIATQTCAGCQAVLSTGSEGHTKDEDANCMHATHCSVCDGYYGNTLSHRMGAWLPADDGQRHYRTCEYGCGETEYAAHDVTRTASCVAPASCRDCGVFGEVDADAHDWTEWKLWDNDQHWRYCRNNVSEHVEYADHTGGTATCEARAMCDVCDEYYGQKLGHDFVEHEGKEPTCTEGGWYEYVTCSRCDYNGYVEKPALGHDYTAKTTKPGCTTKGYTTHTCTRCQDSYRDGVVAARGHDYGEWTPNADGTHTAVCLRGCGNERTTACTPFTTQLWVGDACTELDRCPVCGEVCEVRLYGADGELTETLDGVRLLLVEDATAEALTEALPAGALVVRMEALPNGETMMSVAFELDGAPTQPTGQVKITLPAELLEGYALWLIAEDGTETALPVEIDEEAETVAFVLDFTDSETPVQLMRVVPEV